MPARIAGIGWISSAGAATMRNGADFAIAEGPLPEIGPASICGNPDPYFRRLDAYSKLGVTAVALALQDAGLDRWTAKRNIGIIAATRYGCLRTDMDYFETVVATNGIGASPSLFSYTLPSTFLGEAALRFGLTGPTFVIGRNSPFEPRCLQLGLETIEDGEAERMLCGICDLGAPPVLNGGGPPAGALFFVLERETAAPSNACVQLRLGSGNRIYGGAGEIKDLAVLVRECRRQG